MYFFISIFIIGISLVLNTYFNSKSKEEIIYKKRFNIEFIDKYIFYIESGIITKTNIKQGMLLILCSLLGILFYEKLGLLMFSIIIFLMIIYFTYIFINLYKYIKK